MADSKTSYKLSHCRKCAQDTKHDVLIEKPFTELDHDSDGTPIASFTTIWFMLECRGCEAVSLRSEFSNDAHEGIDPDVAVFPPRVSRISPPWHGDLPQDTASLLREVYAALNSNSKRLALMGARTLLDIILVKKVGDVGGFNDKLKSMESNGFITKSQKKVLDAALNTGSAVAHRGLEPTDEQVTQVMSIVEYVLQEDLLVGAAKKLRKSTPARRRRK